MKLLRGAGKVLLWVAVPVVVVLAILKVAYVDVVTLGHNAMAPTLMAGDSALVWRGAVISHGDIALCRHPTEEGRYVLARAIAMPDMSVTTDRGHLVINGSSPTGETHGEVSFTDPTRDEARRTLRLAIEQLGNDRYWVLEDRGRPLRIRRIESLDGIYLLSDNRSYPGEDSRAFGTVLAGECLGQAFLRFSPGDLAIEGVPHGWLDMLSAPL
jgi:hypothetical protein